MKLKINSISGFFFKLFWLFFPLQIQTLLYKADFFSGQLNNFSSFFFLISEGFLIAALFFHGLEKLITNSSKEKLLDSFSGLETVLGVGLISIFIWSMVSVFWADDKILAMLFSLRLLELLGLIYLLIDGCLPRDVLLKYLCWGAFFQVIIGLGQYLKQGDLGLSFLGESALAPNNLNVAKVDLAGEKILRAYGTFAHANIFGGYLVICFGLVLQKLSRENYWKYLHFLTAFLVGILLSFSRSAWLATAALLLILLAVQAIRVNWKQIAIAAVVLLFVIVIFSLDQIIWARFADLSLLAMDERLIFSDIARQMIWQNPWFGVGMGNFVISMPNYYSGILSPWLYQPVHNFFLLILSELGAVGMFFWVVSLFAALKQVNDSMRRIIKSERYYWKVYWAVLFALLVLSMLDHYLYTTWAGQVVLMTVLGLIWKDYRLRRLELTK